ncbi:MAG: AAA family ATPase [Oscillospiraceae bacterium]|nr:AAA family ATPase [Oscillospiraceae bacterium]MCL2279887.1 AAA family ATPase [Oscillospiraceae bacterium]
MNMFQNGAKWLKSDFHLHTKSDKGRFTYTGEDNSFVSDYVSALKSADINIGIVTNHNKFDFGEFKALKSKARKQDIFLMPGIELSVGDGANGIHTLVVFSDEWLDNGDLINQFITSQFPGKTPEQYENESGRTNKNLIDTLKDLEGYHKDYFAVMAHVEEANGLWSEFDGGRLIELGRSELFRNRVLGFQKVRTHDNLEKKCRVKVQGWLKDAYPAEVEGSDPGCLEDIGRQKPCYIKLGALTFDAVKFALTAPKDRVGIAPQLHTHSHIKQISFEGGVFDKQTIKFSPQLNTLIGIRGSGKSSIMEALRYTLGLPFEHGSSDYDYKKELIARTFGSGGKAVIDAVDRHGEHYQISRFLNEIPDVYIDEELQPGLTINETILHKPLFFGQRELAANSDGAEKDLIEKMLGNKCVGVRQRIEEQKIKVIEVIEQLSKVQNVDELIKEQNNALSDAKHKLKLYEDHKLEEKLKKRIGFDKDVRKVEDGIRLAAEFLSEGRDFISKYEDDLRNFPGHNSTDNTEFFTKFDAIFSGVIEGMNAQIEELNKIETIVGALKNEQEVLKALKRGLLEEFAEVERVLAEELSLLSKQRISTDDFLTAQRKLNAAEAKLVELVKRRNIITTLNDELNTELTKLRDLWYEEYKIIEAALVEVSERNTALKFTVEYRGDKEAFLMFFKEIFRGSNIRTTAYESIVDKYPDFKEIYAGIDEAKQHVGANQDKFVEIFMGNLKNLMTFQTPNKYIISYHGIQLEHHSLGQRASALIIFVLGQQENDVIIIDQPEDDLDSKTIYDDVIKLIRELKQSVQFIFATHNPNITVLGDAEQIHGCSFADEKISITGGALDDPHQQELIVNVMEGGKDAFERRKEIYKGWK